MGKLCLIVAISNYIVVANPLFKRFLSANALYRERVIHNCVQFVFVIS